RFGRLRPGSRIHQEQALICDLVAAGTGQLVAVRQFDEYHRSRAEPGLLDQLVEEAELLSHRRVRRLQGLQRSPKEFLHISTAAAVDRWRSTGPATGIDVVPAGRREPRRAEEGRRGRESHPVDAVRAPRGIEPVVGDQLFVPARMPEYCDPAGAV